MLKFTCETLVINSFATFELYCDQTQWGTFTLWSSEEPCAKVKGHLRSYVRFICKTLVTNNFAPVIPTATKHGSYLHSSYLHVEGNVPRSNMYYLRFNKCILPTRLSYDW